MGFFSWRTQDTNKSIANVHTGKSFKVVMRDNKGNEWVEDAYDGHGRFGGKDFYALLAQMNDADGVTGDDEQDRRIGISLSFGISAIKNKKTGVIYKASGIDFFNWQDEKIHDGKSANELLETGEWEKFNIKEENIIYPNLTEAEGIAWVNEKPEECKYQGYFYNF